MKLPSFLPVVVPHYVQETCLVEVFVVRQTLTIVTKILYLFITPQY